MIKPFLQLLVAATCLALLDQSNGEQNKKCGKVLRACDSFWYNCIGRKGSQIGKFAQICVPSKVTLFRGCQKAVTRETMKQWCLKLHKELKQDPVVYLKAARTLEICTPR